MSMRVWVVVINHDGHAWEIDSIWSTQGAAEQRSQSSISDAPGYDADVMAFTVDGLVSDAGWVNRLPMGSSPYQTIKARQRRR